MDGTRRAGADGSTSLEVTIDVEDQLTGPARLVAMDADRCRRTEGDDRIVAAGLGGEVVERRGRGRGPAGGKDQVASGGRLDEGHVERHGLCGGRNATDPAQA